MQFIRYFTLTILLASPLFIQAARLADDIEPGDGVNEIQLPLTKQSAAELIRAESNGKILSVDEEFYKNTNVFRIKVIHDNGNVKYYRLDPNTAHPPK